MDTQDSRGRTVAHASACSAGTRAGVACVTATRMSLLHAPQTPGFQVIEIARKPGRPIDNRPQVDNLPDTALGGVAVAKTRATWGIGL